MVNLESVWDRTSEFLSDHLSDVVPIALLLIFVPLCLMGNVMPLIGWTGSVADIALSLVALALALVTIWGNLALTALVVGPPEWKAAARLGGGRVPVAVLVMLIELAVAAAAVAPVFVTFALSGFTPGQTPSAAPTMSLGAAWFILLYTPVLAIVGIVLIARLMLFDAALVAERRGVSALLRSWRLTNRMTWKLIGVTLLYVVVSQVAALATRTVFGAILGLLTAGDGTVNVATVTTATLVALVQTGFTALATVFTARLFLAVRDVRETIVELA